MKLRAPLLVAALLGCSDPNPPLPSALRVTPFVNGLSAPIFLASPPGDARVFIAEQGGRIRVVVDGALVEEPFLDISSKISAGGERGLLGFAFHPDFATNGFFYVNYTDLNGDTKIERYHAQPSALTADAASASHVLGIPQPFSNHNGGMLLFGPDGNLWIGTGDGGSGGDPQGNGQRTTTLLGKMLRISVGAADGYAIPLDNPFATSTAVRTEIWGLGLRNPWRYSIDRGTGLLYVADVGQNAWEEIHVVRTNASPVNFGWVIMEGTRCYNAESCDMNGLDIPVLEYPHAEGCSITGGFVYRGSFIPGIRGHYFYSDFCTGFLRSFRYADGRATQQREWDVGDLGNVMSFGEDSAGELYILSSNGTVYRIVPP
ncbi:MAG TPA: PQQ-dependent sugar dehydrogenase [Gemmatimonadaceae bacterium]|nr:PQQ-dependent sugar dehydrogenase [Gemmatimonadaceae bacterium]